MMILACALIRTYQAQYVLESRDTGMITKHLYIDRGAITFAQMRSKFHLGVFRIVVPDEASNKPHHNRLPGAIGHPLAAQAQGRQATGGEEKQQHSFSCQQHGRARQSMSSNALLK